MSYDYCFNVKIIFATTHREVCQCSGNKCLQYSRSPVPGQPCPFWPGWPRVKRSVWWAPECERLPFSLLLFSTICFFNGGVHPGAPLRTSDSNLFFLWLRVLPGYADRGQCGVGVGALAVNWVLMCTWLLMGRVTSHMFLDLFGHP